MKRRSSTQATEYWVGLWLPSLGAVAAAAGDGVLAGDKFGVGVLVALLLVGGREGRLAGGDGSRGGDWREEKGRSLLAVGDAAVPGDGRQERRVRLEMEATTGNGEGDKATHRRRRPPKRRKPRLDRAMADEKQAGVVPSTSRT